MGLAAEPPSDATPQQPAKPPVTLLYDTLVDPSVVMAARATQSQPLMIAYQYCSPESQKTGRIEVGAVLMCIDKMTSGDPPEWGMLDFEYNFTDRMQKGLTPEAKVAREEMVKLIRAVRAAYPRTKWTYYGVPFLPYWMDGKSWTDASDEQKRALMESCAQMYEPLVAECDWVSPSIYPVYDPTMFKPYEQAGVRAAGVAWRTAQVAFAKLLGRGKPVIPTISPLWQPGGLAASGTVVPPREFVLDQVQPALDRLDEDQQDALGEEADQDRQRRRLARMAQITEPLRNPQQKLGPGLNRQEARSGPARSNLRALRPFPG